MSYIPNDVIEKLDSLSCETVAADLGIEVSRHRAVCFVHDDHHPSLGFYGDNRSRWHCFVCGVSGNAISLVEQYSGCSFVDACLWLCKQYSIAIDGISSKKRVPKPQFKRRKISEMPKRPFDVDVAQWIIENTSLGEICRRFLFDQRHLLPEVIAAQKITSIEDKNKVLTELLSTFGEEKLEKGGFVTITNNRPCLRFFTPCMIIPYFDMKNQIIGLQTRYLGDNPDAPRFQFLSSQKTHLYNMQSLNDINEKDELFISEGITDCLALLSCGKKAVAIPSASNIPELDLTYLRGKKLIMYPDNDTAGQKAFVKLRSFFINQYTILSRRLLPDNVKDYCDYYVSIYGQGK